MSDKEHESDVGAPGDDREKLASSFRQRQEAEGGGVVEARAPAGGADAVSTSEELDAPTLGEVLAEIEAEAVAGQPSLEAVEQTESRLLLLFSQGDNRFAVEVDNVLEVIPVPESTWVPGVAGWVQGVTNFRGEIISIVSLGQFLELDLAVPANGSSRLLVVESREDQVRSGLVVDGIHGNVRASRDEIRPLTGAVQARLAPYLRGLLRAKGELHTLLDLESLLVSQEFRAVGSVR